MLASLCDLGYEVEWRVVNAADYGFPQKRRRVFIVARLQATTGTIGSTVVHESGVLAKALPVLPEHQLDKNEASHLPLNGAIHEISALFGLDAEKSLFGRAGFARTSPKGGKWKREVWTYNPEVNFTGKKQTLGEVLQKGKVDAEFLVEAGSIEKWKTAKGSKAEDRVHPATGFKYKYTEGALPFPDPLDRPARTILTSEGGASATRSKHIVAMRGGGYRRLTPVELERLNGFEDNHTSDVGMSNSQRAFCMGNALVVGLVELIGSEIAHRENLL
jgi:DNA (cytosine-5)-methyltransferase 1